MIDWAGIKDVITSILIGILAISIPIMIVYFFAVYFPIGLFVLMGIIILPVFWFIGCLIRES